MYHMIKAWKTVLWVGLLTVCFLGVSAQISQPVKWSYTTKHIKDNVVEIQIKATVEKDWHLYSQFNTEGITQQTVFTYEPSASYQLTGKTSEPPYKEFTDEFGTDRYFDKSPVVFKQRIKVLSEKDFDITASVDAQACIEGKCVMAGDDFTFHIKGIPQKETSNDATVVEAIDTNTTDTLITSSVKDKDSTTCAQISENQIQPNQQTKEKAWWIVFLVSFLAGLLALITPCVFPMIPMTISFFMKGEKSRKQGLKQAYFFGASIIFIFAVLGLALTLLLGKDAMYIISTHWVPNVIFFLIFMVFAFSFFGLFEITLPSSWINKSDQQSDKGGYLGSFFIALTTVLVSFSCTGPILGAALIEMASGSSNSLVFFISMIGFALGFALPFTLLAMFPTMIGKMKSGSWLNTVKIVFGFLEIALGLKFLSMADLSADWGILDRETYLALWIVTFSLLGMYFLGKLRFKGDAPVETISVGRLFLALITFSFVVYMIPGLWGAPLKALSGYVPPMTTQDFNIERSIVENSGGTKQISGLPADRKYADKLHLPTGFEGFFDLEEAKAYAKKVGKPIFVDFTGKTCANCREMEYYVWNDPMVKPILQNDFIMVALYADANTIKLPEKDWLKTSDGKTIKTLGKKNLNYQIENFNVNAQPLYVLMDGDGNLLTKEPKAYDRDVNNFVTFLQEGLTNFKKK
ncbi:MAG TPA: cytochrome c biogenesis protein CcdA [Bacteroidales bacterium]|nr:cytochrome c biogenesis protein CcdA [Bacteroidales bacterium]